MFLQLPPIKRVLIIALISGIVSGIIVTAIMWLWLASAWFFFIIPAIMGWSIRKFAHITAAEADADENLEKKVGWTCAGIVFFFVFLTALVVAAATYNVTGNYWAILMNVVFYLISGVAVWYGYKRGAEAVTDAYFDEN